MLDRRALLGSAAAFCAAPALGAPAKGPAALNALFDQFMKENLDNSPMSVTAFGLDTGARAAQKRQIDDASLAGIARNKQIAASQLARLKAFDRASVGGQDQINYDVILYGLQSADEANRRFAYGAVPAGQPYVISQLTGNYCNTPSFLDTQHTIESKSDAQAYLARLEGFARALTEEIEVARHDAARGVVAPDFALANALKQMNDLRAPAPGASPLTESLARRTREKKIAGDWSGQAAKVVADKIYPALERQIALVKELQKKAVHDAGAWRLPDGEAYYRASLKSWATTDMRPEEIHRLGLEIVRDHTAQIDAIMKAQGLTRGTVGERLHAMHTDKRFIAPDTDAAKEKIIADLNAKVKQVRAKLPAMFATLPKADVRIMRVPKNIQAAQPGGYYNQPSLDGKRPGIYWINLRDTAEVPAWTLPTLTYHEGIPGHHLQLSIQQEASLPLIRKTSFFSAYIEGWALYAEQVAVEMGMYRDDPLAHIGQLHGSMFRGVRLVVDSGMHALKWSREKALRYYVDTLGDAERSAATEIERYSVWPGQACSYMLGKLAFLRARDQAKSALGGKFDIRKFHDAMLLAGAVPLAVLDGITARHIAASKA